MRPAAGGDRRPAGPAGGPLSGGPAAAGAAATGAGPGTPRRRPGPGWALLLPLALAALAYARVLHGEFQFDDRPSVEENPEVKAPALLLERPLLTGEARPLTDLSFALDHALWRLDPFGYHLVNLLLHLAVVALLHRLSLLLLRRAGAASPDGTALAVAGIFAVHPLASQAVSYVSQRAEVLASLLYLAGLLLLLAAERRGRSAAGAIAWAGALVAYLAGLHAKAVAVTLPAAWILVALALPRQGATAARRGARALLQVAPFLAVAAAFAARTAGALRGRSDAGLDVPGVPPLAYALSQPRVVLGYLRLLLWPAGQNLDHQVAVSSGLDGATLAAAAALALLLVGSAMLAARARSFPAADRAAARLWLFGLAWFLLLLSPTSSLVPLADLMEEHRAYLASWGPLLGLAAGAERLLARLEPRRRRALALAGVSAAWLGLALALHARNAVWESRRALWADVTRRSPGKVRAWVNLGHALAGEGALEEAVQAYRRALAMPGDPTATPSEIRRNLGAALAEMGRTAEAVQVLRQALGDDPRNPELWNNLAICLLDLGDLQEAERAVRRALEISPHLGPAWSTLGEVQLRLGDAEGARASFERAIALDPDVALRRHNLAVALRRLGRNGEACRAAAEALAAERSARGREQALRFLSDLGCGPRGGAAGAPP